MFEQYTVTGKFLNNDSSEKAQQIVSGSIKGTPVKMAFAEKVANGFVFPILRHVFSFLYGEIKETGRKLKHLPNTFSISNRCAEGA